MASIRGFQSLSCGVAVLMFSAAGLAQSAPQAELQGYCPASYLLEGKAVKGSPAHSMKHQGKVYHFANKKAMDAFQAAPAKYLPQFNGMCTVALGGMYGNRIAPDPKIFEARDGKVYLFCAERARKLFVKNPDKYIPSAAKRFADQPADAEVKQLVATPPRTTSKKPPQRKKRPAMELVGATMPASKFSYAAGGEFNPATMEEEAAVVMFYASWCGACKKTLPKLNELATSYAGKPVRFVGISQDTLVDAPDPSNRRGVTRDFVKSQWKQLGATFPQAFDPSNIGRVAYKVTSFPTMFLLNKNAKKVEGVYVGGGAVFNGQLKNDIDAILKPKVSSGAPTGTNRVAGAQ